MVDDEDSLLLVGTSTICVATNEVPVQSRIAQGVKMIKDGEVYSVVKL
jgi:hypothetical protein